MVSMSEFVNAVQSKVQGKYSPVTTVNGSATAASAQSQQKQTNAAAQDKFEKTDNTKKIVKYSLISAGIAAVSYTAFALIKYKTVRGFFPRIAEPVKVLQARINPNGFKPLVTIEENELLYVGKVAEHVCRLTEKQQVKYVKHLYENSTFTEEGKQDFIRYFGKYLRK